MSRYGMPPIAISFLSLQSGAKQQTQISISPNTSGTALHFFFSGLLLRLESLHEYSCSS
jgi:hypothetical protein